jgi:hypothetical protein
MAATPMVRDASLRDAPHHDDGEMTKPRVRSFKFVMAGLDPAIHVLVQRRKTWMPGTRPGMTNDSLQLFFTAPARS